MAVVLTCLVWGWFVTQEDRNTRTHHSIPAPPGVPVMPKEQNLQVTLHCHGLVRVLHSGAALPCLA